MALSLVCFLVLVASVSSFLSRFALKSRSALKLAATAAAQPPVLFPASPNSIGSFYDLNDEKKVGLECCLAYNFRINDISYVVGFPVDNPVALSFFEKGELQFLTPDLPDYDRVVYHVTNQLKFNDLDLLNTALIMTIQGEFEDESMNDMFPLRVPKKEVVTNEEDISVRELYRNEYQDLMFSTELDEPDTDLMPRSKTSQPEDEEEEDSEDNEDSNDSQETIPEENKLNSTESSYPNLEAFPPEPEPTDEEVRDLKLKHKVADRVLACATDVKLMGSFYINKKVYHLVNLLEPLCVIAKITPEGHSVLLDEEETRQVRPILDRLVAQHIKKVQQLQQVQQVQGIHAKTFPKYSKRTSGSTPASTEMMDEKEEPREYSRNNERNRGGERYRTNKKPPENLTAFQAAQRNWYAQKAASNTRPGLAGYGGGGRDGDREDGEERDDGGRRGRVRKSWGPGTDDYYEQVGQERFDDNQW